MDGGNLHTNFPINQLWWKIETSLILSYNLEFLNEHKKSRSKHKNYAKHIAWTIGTLKILLFFENHVEMWFA